MARQILLRYLGAVILITLAGLAANAGLFVVVPVAVVSLKFLLYDGIVAMIRSKFPRFVARPWFWGGYGLTVAADMLFVYAAGGDAPDAGFAFLGAFVLTPWILVAAFACMVLNTYLGRKR